MCASAAPAADSDQTLRLNATMTQLGNTISGLFPVFLNEISFDNPENEKIIDEGIERIVSLIKTAGPHFNQRSKPSQISYDILAENLRETQRAIQAGNRHYAQNLLIEVVSICTSCHTQDDKQRTLFHGKRRDAFSSDFEYAEFNFLTRNYETAIDYYDRYLKSPYSLKPERVILTSVKKLLTIYAQVLNEPGRGAAHFNKLIQSGRLPPLVEKNVTEWIKGLEQLQADQASKVTDPSFEELDKYVHQYLGPLNSPGSAIVPTKKQKVYHLWLQGLLYRYFSSEPSPQTVPLLLYWLSINDRATNYSFYYSLADLYLKECMLKHTENYMAKQCFDEYNEYITFSYSGSLGTEIPEEEQRELKRLRDIVYGGKSPKSQ
ncbi:MAG: hypothetical protein LJE85_10860 [Gammaproteobacteria bacterium]|jgi:hypothetical protein|nr:hypothetical protein [Gammaproteobacteria bacterium]